MNFTQEIIACQNPKNNFYIDKNYHVVKVTVSKNSKKYDEILASATELAGLVNAGAANESAHTRNDLRKLTDSFAGLLSEYAWRDYLNTKTSGIASFTKFDEAQNQIDIILANGEKIEVRSSTVRKGVKFAICSSMYNFKNIGPYSNAIKPGEIVKDFYCGVLFETQKDELLDVVEIVFYLVGSSTWKMMMDIGKDSQLNAYDAISLQPGNYRIIQYKDTLDVQEFINHLKTLGY